MPENSTQKINPRIRSKLWIEIQEEVVFGDGRMALLQAIEETGSIQQASAKLNISYRAAWGKIKATEERLGMSLVETHIGGNHKGTNLTEQGRLLVNTYSAFKSKAIAAVDDLYNQYFGDIFKLDNS
ncbi:MAG: LysR family transcriptional regulator [Clostridia bacterium]|nr:LysR family transcriptional regulator [Clostridia bacterium]